MTTKLNIARMLDCLRQFRDNRSGAIAMLFALILVPILLVIGLAIDYGHSSHYQSSIQKTLDEAAVAGASELAKSGDAQRAIAAAERRFMATAPKAYTVQSKFEAEPRMKTLTANASANVPMTFMALAGFQQVTVTAHAVAQVKKSKTERSQPRARQMRQVRQAIARMSDHDIGELIYRAENACSRLREMGFADRVPQCGSILNGTFERQLRAELAAPDGNVNRLLPGGVRLVQ